MPKLLLEDTCGEFIVDRANIVTESTPSGGTLKVIPGRFSICDTLNGNKRKYPYRVWEKNLQPDSVLISSIKRNGCFGLLEHPEDGKIDLRSPIAVMITEARMGGVREQSSGPIEVVGKIKVLDTEEGKKLQALIDAGYNPFVSSRGFGSLVKDSEGVDIVQDDFVCEGWDVVLKPSFVTAELWPNRGGTSNTESISKEPTLKESQPSTGSANAGAQPSNPKINKTMELKQIRESIATLKGVDAKNMTPSRLAEGLSRMEELHSEIAAFAAQDPKNSWTSQKLHKELEEIETSWNETAKAPQLANAKLREDNTKVMKVMKAITETAVTYKTKLAEAVQQQAENRKLIEELVKRGQAWKNRADEFEAKNVELTEAFEIASGGCDELSALYLKHMTQAGAKILQMEFAGKLTPELQKQLKEASHPNHIIKIREQLVPTAAPAPAAAAAAPAVEPKKEETPAPAATTSESTPAAAVEPKKEEAPISAAPAAENPAPVKEGKEPAKVESNGPISSMMESVKIARRLSTAATAK